MCSQDLEQRGQERKRTRSVIGTAQHRNVPVFTGIHSAVLLYPTTSKRNGEAIFWTMSYYQVPSAHRMKFIAIGCYWNKSLERENEKVGGEGKILTFWPSSSELKLDQHFLGWIVMRSMVSYGGGGEKLGTQASLLIPSLLSLDCIVKHCGS